MLPQNTEDRPGGGGGAYTKWKDGANRIRPLADAIIGWECWYDDEKGKPAVTRRLTKEDPQFNGKQRKNVQTGQLEASEPRCFVAFVCWNYDAGRVEICSVTQRSIFDAIEALEKNPQWGDSKGYDLTVTKQGSGLQTTYNVQPNPKSALTQDIINAMGATPININALLQDGDPFDENIPY